MGPRDRRVALRCHRRSRGHPTVCSSPYISTSFRPASDCSKRQGPSSSSSLGLCSSSTTYNPSREQRLAAVGWVLGSSWASLSFPLLVVVVSVSLHLFRRGLVLVLLSSFCHPPSTPPGSSSSTRGLPREQGLAAVWRVLGWLRRPVIIVSSSS